MTQSSSPSLFARLSTVPTFVQPAAWRAARSVSASTGWLTHEARTLPGFLIVGAQRSGTTSMYHTLSQHPAVLKAALHKGVHYFDTGYDHSLAWYQGHFPLRAHAARVERADRRCPADVRVEPVLHVPSAGGGADQP